MEATKLRRKLDPIDPWDNAKSERVKPVIAEIAKSCGVEITPTLPRWEYGVYPLYYLYRSSRADNLNVIRQKIRDDYLIFFPETSLTCKPEQIAEFVDDIANTEVDLLIEDHDYFIFVEAKDPPEGRPARFEIKRGVHQLVLQYAEGLFLAKKTKKKFFLATLGTKINSVTASCATWSAAAIAVGWFKNRLRYPTVLIKCLHEPRSDHNHTRPLWR